jgi:hypothetical protein
MFLFLDADAFGLNQGTFLRIRRNQHDLEKHWAKKDRSSLLFFFSLFGGLFGENWRERDRRAERSGLAVGYTVD